MMHFVRTVLIVYDVIEAQWGKTPKPYPPPWLRHWM